MTRQTKSPQDVADVVVEVRVENGTHLKLQALSRKAAALASEPRVERVAVPNHMGGYYMQERLVKF